MIEHGKHIFFVEPKNIEEELRDLPSYPYIRFEGVKNIMSTIEGVKETRPTTVRYNIKVSGVHKNKPDMVERFCRRGDRIVGLGNFPFNDPNVARSYDGNNPYRALFEKCKHEAGILQNSTVMKERDALAEEVAQLKAKYEKSGASHKGKAGAPKGASSGEVQATA